MRDRQQTVRFVPRFTLDTTSRKTSLGMPGVVGNLPYCDPAVTVAMRRQRKVRNRGPVTSTGPSSYRSELDDRARLDKIQILKRYVCGRATSDTSVDLLEREIAFNVPVGQVHNHRGFIDSLGDAKPVGL